MLGKTSRAGNIAKIKGRTVIGFHGTLIVCSIFVYEHHALYGITFIEEHTEYFHQICGDVFMANHLSDKYLSLIIIMECLDVAQIGARRGAVGLIRLSLYTTERFVGNCHTGKATINATILPNIGKADFPTGIPLPEVGQTIGTCVKRNCGEKEQYEKRFPKEYAHK